jgi:hypothetical protein
MEAVYGLVNVPTGRKTVCVNGTILALIEFGAIPDEEQATLEGCMISVQEIFRKYDLLVKSWPFLIAQRLLKMQLCRF